MKYEQANLSNLVSLVFSHTCTMTLDVTIDAHVSNLLKQHVGPNPNEAGEFDLWWHKMIYGQAKDYNRL